MSSCTGSLKSQGFYEMQVRDQIPRIFHHTILENKFLQYEIKVSRSQISWQIEELVLYNAAVLVSLLLLIPTCRLYQLASIRKKTMPNSLNPRRVPRKVRLEQVDLQKSPVMYPMSSVYRAPIQNRGHAFLWDSE